MQGSSRTAQCEELDLELHNFAFMKYLSDQGRHVRFK